MEESELIDKLRNKDLEAFRIIVDKYQSRVLNSCYRFVLNRETAEDLTQEVFIEVFRSIKNFREDSAFSTWIYRVAVSKSLDYLKTQKAKKRLSNIMSILQLNDDKIVYKADQKNNPDIILENEERIKVLSSAIEKLPVNQKIAFTLSKYDELSYRDIAVILDVSVPAVESLIQRAKSNLRKRLYKYYKNGI